eukprot:1195335-Prorocentrum_minimum.AAC.4
MESTMDPASKLAALRQLMREQGVAAYVVPTDDPHQSEYVADRFARRQFISDFTGSAGTAVITLDKALLWTDGRYFTQATNQLDAGCWSLMKDRMPDTIAIEDFLCQSLASGDKVTFL